jgi:TetR/AcrR family transcriptional repressor of lmrAB and yxaGH operons
LVAVPRVTDTRKRMISTAARLLRRQGYAATGWRQVIADSGTPWGSQAHHFPGGKTQLAAEAIDRAAVSYERLLRAALADQHPADAVLAWADAAASELDSSGWRDGCPVATVALEMSHQSDELAASCAAAFARWRDALADAIAARGATRARSKALAIVVLAGIEGAMLLARAEHDAGPLRVVGRELATLLRERVP